jgi:hypothetical protein
MQYGPYPRWVDMMVQPPITFEPLMPIDANSGFARLQLSIVWSASWLISKPKNRLK